MPRRKAAKKPTITSEEYMASIDAIVSRAMESRVSSGLVVGHLFVAMERLAHELARSDDEGVSGPEMFATWLETIRDRTMLRVARGTRRVN